MKPEISIVLITWNRAPMLRRCLDGLYAALDPDIRREILIFDNASTDGTAEILSGYANRPDTTVILSKNNLRLRAYKKLFWRARGRIIIEVDDDVLAFPPNFDRTLRNHLDAYPDYGFLSLDVIRNEKTDGEKPPEARYRDDCRGKLVVQEGPAGGWCAAFRKRDYLLVWPFTLFFSFKFNRPEDYVITGLFRRVLHRRDGIIKGVHCFHACGPVYSKEMGLLERDLEKYRAGGVNDMAKIYKSVLESSTPETNEY